MTLSFSSDKEAQLWREYSAKHLSGIKRGLEKESLRISTDGHISKKPHPQALGSALTHPLITTDYSEALLEFITPPTEELHAPLDYLRKVHHYVYQNLGDELLWGSSMPCVMGEENDIPIAQYGSSNSGKMKSIYRLGLGHRYGRFMQTIAGVHYNFSLPDSLWKMLYEELDVNESFQDFKSARYFGLIRNFLRHGWIIPYLFGASPALCESFIKGRPTRLKELVPGTRYGKYATSLRMSDLGYQNSVQSRLKVCTNKIEQYIDGLEYAIRTEDEYYKEIGIQSNGEYRQLNANLLQIENEYYSNIRPKRTTQSGERPTKALKARGVEYIEVRALDLNPFSDIGVEQDQLYFLDAFLLMCAMSSSPCLFEREESETKENLSRVVNRGRDSQLHLLNQNKEVLLKDQAQCLFESMALPARLLDEAYGATHFSEAVAHFEKKISSPEQTYSGKIVEAIERRRDGFFPYAFELASQYSHYFKSLELSKEDGEKMQSLAAESIEQQKIIESNDSKTFEEFLADYFA